MATSHFGEGEHSTIKYSSSPYMISKDNSVPEDANAEYVDITLDLNIDR